MKSIPWLATFAALAFLGVSCKSGKDVFEPESPERALEELKETEIIENKAVVRRRLEAVNDYIFEKEFDEAEKLLMTLDKFEFCRKDVAVMRASIAEGRKKLANDVEEKHSTAVMERENDERLKLADTYGKTVVIDAKLSQLELPEGKMEDLINRKVTMNLESATVGMLVDFLNENGLNVIADDALGSDKTLTMKVTNVPLKEVLSYIARNMGIAFYIGENMVWITAGEDSGGPRLETRILKLRRGFVPKLPAAGAAAPGSTMGGAGTVESVEDTELEDVLTAFLEGSPEGSMYQIYRTRNIMVIRNTRENIRFVEQILRDFDKPPLQVAIEARFITVGQSDLRDIGVQLSNSGHQDYGDDEIKGTKIQELNFLSDFGSIEDAGTLGLSGVIGKRLFEVVIQAIDKKESSITLSAPRLTVMNNRSARIRKGEVVYYFDEYDIESVDNGDDGSDQRLVPSGDPVELPLGLTFDVSVNVGNDSKSIMLGLRPEIVKLLKWEDYLTTGDDDDDDSENSTGFTSVKLPRTHEQSVVTNVSIQSGETVVLGGLIENTKKHSVQKIPFLGDLPVLGWLFKRKTVSEEPVNLLIFVTAHVINDHGEYVQAVSADDVMVGAAAPAKRAEKAPKKKNGR